jgi:hypothetical protein
MIADLRFAKEKKYFKNSGKRHLKEGSYLAALLPMSR